MSYKIIILHLYSVTVIKISLYKTVPMAVHSINTSCHHVQILGCNGTVLLQINDKIRLLEHCSLFIKLYILFRINSQNDLILSCTNISLALLCFGIPNNLRVYYIFMYNAINYWNIYFVMQNIYL